MQLCFSSTRFLVKGKGTEKLIEGSAISYSVTKNIYVHIPGTVAEHSLFQDLTVLYGFTHTKLTYKVPDSGDR